MKKICNVTKFAVALALIAVFFFVDAQECKAGFKLTDLDEQRAVNLSAKDIKNWGYNMGKKEKWNESYDENYVAKFEDYTFPDGYKGQVYFYVHKDKDGKKWKGLIGAGSKAKDLFLKGLYEAMLSTPEEMNDKDATKRAIKEGKDSVTNYDGIFEVIEAASENMGEGYPYVYCAYYYRDTEEPACYAQIIMSATGREIGYKTAQRFNDKESGKKDGYSIKKALGNIPGYYYTQEIIKLGGDKYWKITVKPML